MHHRFGLKLLVLFSIYCFNLMFLHCSYRSFGVYLAFVNGCRCGKNYFILPLYAYNRSN